MLIFLLRQQIRETRWGGSYVVFLFTAGLVLGLWRAQPAISERESAQPGPCPGGGHQAPQAAWCQSWGLRSWYEWKGGVWNRREILCKGSRKTEPPWRALISPPGQLPSQGACSRGMTR